MLQITEIPICLLHLNSFNLSWKIMFDDSLLQEFFAFIEYFSSILIIYDTPLKLSNHQNVCENCHVTDCYLFSV